MNFYDTLKKYLTDKGVREDHAAQILHTASQHSDFSNMTNRWSDDASNYPEVFTGLLTGLLTHIVYDWVRVNQPQAWYLPFFSPAVQGLSGEDLKQAVFKVQEQKRAGTLPSWEEYMKQCRETTIQADYHTHP